ncbi:MAG: DUF4160 domain-containing protein [Xanthomonadales bacterium]|nr:DUF4160 domain-containing protein [Xanthomonadales bacterium]
MYDDIERPDGPMTAAQKAVADRLSTDDLSAIDEALMSNVISHWRKVARVVATTMNDLSGQHLDLPDVFFSQRIKHLVRAGRLESFGNPDYMRYSESRLPAHGGKKPNEQLSLLSGIPKSRRESVKSHCRVGALFSKPFSVFSAFTAADELGVVLRTHFFSREEPRMRVHVLSGDGEAKFCLEPEIELARNYRFNRAQLRTIEQLIESHYDELTAAWKKHFC